MLSANNCGIVGTTRLFHVKETAKTNVNKKIRKAKKITFVKATSPKQGMCTIGNTLNSSNGENIVLTASLVFDSENLPA
jgi:hypothetical protein